MDLLAQSLRAHIGTNYRRTYDFAVEFEAGAGISMPPPPDIGVFVKELSYGPVEVETVTVKAGSKKFTLPVGAEPVTFSFTLRDTQDEKIGQWLDSISRRIFNEDGTQNAPYDPQRGWILKMIRYRLIYDHEENIKREKAGEYEVLFTQRGDVTESTEAGFVTYPVTFIQFLS